MGSVGVNSGLLSESFPPRIIRKTPTIANRRNKIYSKEALSPYKGRAKNTETNGAQFITITVAVRQKYLVDMNKA